MISSLGEQITIASAGPIVDFARKNPEKNLQTLLSLAQKLDRNKLHTPELMALKEAINDKDSNIYALVTTLLKEIQPNNLKAILCNFILRGSVYGYTQQKELSAELGYNIPWAILMDPTTACNLHCTGCWAAEYDHGCNLSFEDLDNIIQQGKELGIYNYFFSGGEPLMRKKTLLQLFQTHSDCYFVSFTNGTLVDEDFVKEIAKTGNFSPIFSIEGFEKETDLRRGAGTYQKVLHAMDLMHDAGLIFGYSTCYHALNAEVVGSDEYVDFLIEKGAKFAWYFTYMPVGNSAPEELLASPKQREYMYHRIREIRATKPLLAMDFWNDGEYVGGCVAGGRRYLHINANGDVEPCAFIHYATHNIHNSSLRECLKSPLFAEYRQNQPFNNNHLRPCPLLDNPEKLAEMVHRIGAASTDLASPENVDTLCGKCKTASERWAPLAETLWNKTHYEYTGA